MFVEFVIQKEIDLPEAPKGFSWRGGEVKDVDVMTLTGRNGRFGYVAIHSDRVSAGSYDAQAVLTPLGTFATPREAAAALIAALEVQP